MLGAVQRRSCGRGIRRANCRKPRLGVEPTRAVHNRRALENDAITVAESSQTAARQVHRVAAIVALAFAAQREVGPDLSPYTAYENIK